MKSRFLPIFLAGLMSVSACDNLSRDEAILIGGLAGAALGIMTADVLNADRNWTIIAGLAGAAVGTLVAVDEVNDRCAYKRSDGRLNVVRCYR